MLCTFHLNSTLLVMGNSCTPGPSQVTFRGPSLQYFTVAAIRSSTPTPSGCVPSSHGQLKSSQNSSVLRQDPVLKSTSGLPSWLRNLPQSVLLYGVLGDSLLVEESPNMFVYLLDSTTNLTQRSTLVNVNSGGVSKTLQHPPGLSAVAEVGLRVVVNQG